MPDILKEITNGIFTGHTVVGTTKVVASAELYREAIKGIFFRCPGLADPVANTVPIWIGGETVTADSALTTGGMPIAPGEAIFLPLQLITQVYFVSTAAGQDIAWMII